MIWRILALLFFPLLTNAQQTGSLTIVSEQGDPFYLYLNGQKMNETATTKIRLDGLSGEYYTVKADFKSASITAITKRLYLLDANDRMSDATYRIKKDKSGKARFAFYSMQSPNPAFGSEEGLLVIRFNNQTADSTPIEKPETKATEMKNDEPALLTNVKGAKVSLPAEKSSPGNVKAEQSAPKPDNVQQPAKPSPKPAVTTPVVKAEQKKSVDTAAVVVVKKEKQTEFGKKVPEKPLSTIEDVKDQKATTKTPVKEEAYPSKKCNDWPMMKADFLTARKSVEEAKTDKLKLVKAKEMAQDNCLLVSQISEVSTLFTDEKLKLEYVKFAYGFTIDKNNYQRLEKLFTATENISAFKKFHQSH